MRMHNPPHPGEVLRSLCLEPLGLTVSDAARALDVSRKTLSGIVNGRVASAPRWRCASPWRSIPRRRAGSTNRSNTISGERKERGHGKLKPITPGELLLDEGSCGEACRAWRGEGPSSQTPPRRPPGPP